MLYCACDTVTSARSVIYRIAIVAIVAIVSVVSVSVVSVVTGIEVILVEVGRVISSRKRSLPGLQLRFLRSVFVTVICGLQEPE
ncbi:MAG: hypothetical protein P8Y47_12255 [Alphaproteobacteria bacterium]